MTPRMTLALAAAPPAAVMTTETWADDSNPFRTAELRSNAAAASAGALDNADVAVQPVRYGRWGGYYRPYHRSSAYRPYADPYRYYGYRPCIRITAATITPTTLAASTTAVVVIRPSIGDTPGGV